MFHARIVRKIPVIDNIFLVSRNSRNVDEKERLNRRYGAGSVVNPGVAQTSGSVSAFLVIPTWIISKHGYLRDRRVEKPLNRRRMAATLSPRERENHSSLLPGGEGGRGTRSDEGFFHEFSRAEGPSRQTATGGSPASQAFFAYVCGSLSFSSSGMNGYVDISILRTAEEFVWKPIPSATRLLGGIHHTVRTFEDFMRPSRLMTGTRK